MALPQANLQPGIVQHPAQVYSGKSETYEPIQLFSTTLPISVGTQTLPYQYAGTPSPYGTMSGVQPPSSQTRLDYYYTGRTNNLSDLLNFVYSQLHYQQMPRFIQCHPHEVPLQGQFMPSYGQPLPHDVNLASIQQPHELTAMQGHAHFVAQVCVFIENCAQVKVRTEYD